MPSTAVDERHPAPTALRRKVPLRVALEAFACLLLVDVALYVAGYGWLRRYLSAYQSPPTLLSDADDLCAVLLAALDRATVWYPREAMCLHRSLTATWLLRRRGVPAEMVIGCRHTPFYAHAWVEVDGLVVDDRQTVKTLYAEIERL